MAGTQNLSSPSSFFLPLYQDPRSKDWEFDKHKADYTALCKQIWPTAQHDATRISKLSHDSVNRCFAIVITDNEGTPHDYVLRYPLTFDRFKRRDTDYSKVLLRQVAILKWLKEHAPTLKTPTVITYDATDNNPIHTPYMIQERIPGQQLNEILLTLTDQQRLDVAKGLGHFYSEIRQITMPRAGFVNARGEVPELDNSDLHIAIQPFGMPDGCAASHAKHPSPTTNLTITEPASLSTREVLNNAFNRRIITAQQLQKQHNNPLENTATSLEEPLRACRFILDKMATDGCFSDEDDQQFSLWHPDFFPRNILVDLTRSGEAIISGIVDWDAPLFAPGFVSCMPPAWLWAPDRYMNKEGDPIGLFGYYPVEPETELLAQVKAVFEEEAGGFYVKSAYSRDYAIARIFVDFVQFEDWRHHPLFERKEEFIEEWFRRRYPEVSPPCGGESGSDIL